MDVGIVGLFIEPPTTWEVNGPAMTVISPEESHKVLKITLESASRIEAYSSFGSSFSLNRVNSRLDYTVAIGMVNSANWNKAHGGAIPESLGYSYNCSTVKGLGAQ